MRIKGRGTVPLLSERKGKSMKFRNKIGEYTIVSDEYGSNWVDTKNMTEEELVTAPETLQELIEMSDAPSNVSGGIKNAIRESAISVLDFFRSVGIPLVDILAYDEEYSLDDVIWLLYETDKNIKTVFQDIFDKPLPD